jgi:hypothetical protein
MRFQTSTSSYEYIGGGNFKLKTMEKKQTAVEWLAEQRLQGANLDIVIEQAKQMEKEQIEDAFVIRPYTNFEKYYNETYGGNYE